MLPPTSWFSKSSPLKGFSHQNLLLTLLFSGWMSNVRPPTNEAAIITTIRRCVAAFVRQRTPFFSFKHFLIMNPLPLQGFLLCLEKVNPLDASVLIYWVWYIPGREELDTCLINYHFGCITLHINQSSEHKDTLQYALHCGDTLLCVSERRLNRSRFFWEISKSRNTRVTRCTNNYGYCKEAM